MADLNIIVTNAGRAALINAANTGTAPVTVTHCGLSPIAFTPSAATTALPDELKRIATLSGDVVSDDTIHLVVRDESDDQYVLRTLALYLQDGTLFAVYSQADPIMEKSVQAMLLLAVDVRFADIDAADLTFGDANFLNPPATTERLGVVELATDDEAYSGSDPSRTVTAKAMKWAVTRWLNDRFGDGAPSVFIRGLLTAASAVALRSALGLKTAALKDEGPANGLDADLLDGQHGSYYANIPARLGFTPWGPNNDGAGSGLDADTVDGYHAAAFAQLGANVAFRDVTADRGNGTGVIYLGGFTSGRYLYYDGGRYVMPGASLFLNNGTVWTSANDGAGSGLDADLFDGADSSTFISFRGSVPTASIDTATGNGTYLEQLAGASATVLAFNAYGSTGPIQLRFTYGGLLTWRNQTDSKTWTAWRTIWSSANDGPGSGLDADLVDGYHAASFALRGADVTFRDVIADRGNGSGVIYFGASAKARYLYYNGTVYIFSGAELEINGGRAWHSANDGSGSGLDADFLDGQHASYFLPAGNYTAADVRSKLLTVDGSGSGIDADLLDGRHASDFALASDFKPASHATNGYQRLPNGLILQWGRATVSGNAYSNVTLPTAFPSACYSAVVSGTSNVSADANDNGPEVRSVSASSFQVFNANDSSTAIFFFAIGK